ncbi:MAG: hypothetical protein SP1CHLAM54_02390 [Chlamydiia bacterium]|nr:hypothetical protein [Chlamydiia bacterium]MCH9615156.1 hypothetical protein [Chlamydiia bacterium]MCH9628522.1 hypothetical protein [Chlamydiia bacterium]
MTPFEHLIKGLSLTFDEAIGTDDGRTCRFRVNGKFSVQLELDPGLEKVMVGCMISEIPPGKYRENVLKEALKENNELPPRHGTLAYLDRNNFLTLFDYLPVKTMTPEAMTTYLVLFIEKADAWYTAIQEGVLSPKQQESRKDEKPPQHGIKS